MTDLPTQCRKAHQARRQSMLQFCEFWKLPAAALLDLEKVCEKDRLWHALWEQERAMREAATDAVS